VLLDARSDDLEDGEAVGRRRHGGWELYMGETSEVIWADVTIRVKRVVVYAACLMALRAMQSPTLRRLGSD